VFLQGISREAPHCTCTDDVDRLIKKIEDYRMDGYKLQDGRLNAMDRIVTDLYGIRFVAYLYGSSRQFDRRVAQRCADMCPRIDICGYTQIFTDTDRIRITDMDL